MKTKFLVSALVIALPTTLIHAQIPNSGFENWTSMGTYMNLDGWSTPNDSVSSTVFYPATRSTDHYPASIGTYSLRLENNPAYLPGWAAYGIAWTGGPEGVNYPVFPVVGHPTSLWGYFKYMPQNSDTFEIHIRIYDNGVDVAGGQFKTAATVTSWTPFMVPISSYTTADSARIMILACYNNDMPVPSGNSVLYVDNLSLDSLIIDGISETITSPMMLVTPNPANEQVTVSMSNEIHGNMELNVYNAFGELISTQITPENTPFVTIDLTSFSNGIYTLWAVTDEQIVSREKIIVAK